MAQTILPEYCSLLINSARSVLRLSHVQIVNILSNSPMFVVDYIEKGSCEHIIYTHPVPRRLFYTTSLIKIKFAKYLTLLSKTLKKKKNRFFIQVLPLNDAVKQAKEYINSAIAKNVEYEIGKGHGAVHHFFNFWE